MAREICPNKNCLDGLVMKGGRYVACDTCGGKGYVEKK